ncbi:MAG: oligosaccharide flippase family protein [Bacilli bacterium]|nr:oligosaccharide flippase family protein [Bacilli bacterium]
MRTYNSFKNMVFSIISNTLTILIGFVVQKVFLDTLGTEYLGLNSLYTNIVSMLAIADLGIGTAIIYNLYEPIAKNKKDKIKALMSFYKKTYHIISLIIFIFGLILLPFLGIIVGKTTIPNQELIILFILFLIDTVSSYLLSYKRSLLYADQKSYLISIVHIGYLIIMNSLLIAFLLLTQNFYLYLIIKIICRILENVIISILANKKYPYLKEKNNEKLSKEIKNDIILKVKGLFFHKLGSFFVLGTDNILISIFLGVSVVGLYNNYYLIIYALTTLICQGFTSFTASIGNLLTLESKEKSYQIFKRIRFLNFWIAGYTATSILVVMESFISFWYGKTYLLDTGVLIVLVLNYYLTVMRYNISTFKEAAGIFHEDRYIPILESVINIIASLILLKFFGLAGVFLGTILSNLLLHLYSYPKYVFKKLFNKKILDYFKSIISYFLLFIISITITYLISSLITFNNPFIQMITNILISLIIPNLIYYLVFRNKDEYKYFKKTIKKILSNKLKGAR